ncbi:unnamed protein product [Closterium sp. Yama58-4]|nr:unnamed protein product [Closterium sp. Yama58-4]
MGDKCRGNASLLLNDIGRSHCDSRMINALRARCGEANYTSAGYATHCAAAVSCGGDNSHDYSHGAQAEPRRLGAAATPAGAGPVLDRTSPGCTLSPSSVSCPAGFAVTDGGEGGAFILNGRAYIADADQRSAALILSASDGGSSPNSAAASEGGSASSADKGGSAGSEGGFAGSAFTSAALSPPVSGRGSALSFSARFTFQLEGQNEADVATGLAFVITGGPNTAVGSPSLAGYGGAAFDASLAVVLSGRPPISAGLLLGGKADGSGRWAALNPSSPDAPHLLVPGVQQHAWVDYDASLSTLRLFLSGSSPTKPAAPVLSEPVDLPRALGLAPDGSCPDGIGADAVGGGCLFVGFTGGTEATDEAEMAAAGMAEGVATGKKAMQVGPGPNFPIWLDCTTNAAGCAFSIPSLSLSLGSGPVAFEAAFSVSFAASADYNSWGSRGLAFVLTAGDKTACGRSSASNIGYGAAPNASFARSIAVELRARPTACVTVVVGGQVAGDNCADSDAMALLPPGQVTPCLAFTLNEPQYVWVSYDGSTGTLQRGTSAAPLPDLLTLSLLLLPVSRLLSRPFPPWLLLTPLPTPPQAFTLNEPQHVWVSYDGSTGTLQVFVSPGAPTKPTAPVLVTPIDVAAVLGGTAGLSVSVGFTGASWWTWVDDLEDHIIHSLSFQAVPPGSQQSLPPSPAPTTCHLVPSNTRLTCSGFAGRSAFRLNSYAHVGPAPSFPLVLDTGGTAGSALTLADLALSLDSSTDVIWLPGKQRAGVCCYQRGQDCMWFKQDGFADGAVALAFSVWTETSYGYRGSRGLACLVTSGDKTACGSSAMGVELYEGHLMCGSLPICPSHPLLPHPNLRAIGYGGAAPGAFNGSVAVELRSGPTSCVAVVVNGMASGDNCAAADQMTGLTGDQLVHCPTVLLVQQIALDEVQHAWVAYDGTSQSLEVYLGGSDGIKPEEPVLRAALDLVAVIGATSASVGFTAGTWWWGCGDTDDHHLIHSFTFNTVAPGFLPGAQPTTTPTCQATASALHCTGFAGSSSPFDLNGYAQLGPAPLFPLWLDSYDSVGSALSLAPLSLLTASNRSTAFEAAFSFTFLADACAANVSVGRSFAFVLTNGPATALGKANASSLGYGSANGTFARSVAVEFRLCPVPCIAVSSKGVVAGDGCANAEYGVTLSDPEAFPLNTQQRAWVTYHGPSQTLSVFLGGASSASASASSATSSINSTTSSASAQTAASSATSSDSSSSAFSNLDTSQNFATSATSSDSSSASSNSSTSSTSPPVKPAVPVLTAHVDIPAILGATSASFGFTAGTWWWQWGANDRHIIHDLAFVGSWCGGGEALKGLYGILGSCARDVLSGGVLS